MTTRLSGSLFIDVVGAWLEHVSIRLKEASLARYANLIKNHIRPYFKDCRIHDMTNVMLSRFAMNLLEKGNLKTGKGLSAKSVRDVMNIISAILKYAREVLLIKCANFAVLLPRGRKKTIRVFSRSEQTALEQVLRYEPDEVKMGVLLCLYTGLRIGELCALRWTDIDLKERLLFVRRTLQRIQVQGDGGRTGTKIIITDPKSDDSSRTIPLPGSIVGIVKSFAHAPQNAYLLTSDVARFIEPRSMRNHFRKYLAACDVTDATFHSTRHTFATRSIELGIDIKSLSEILGHSAVNFTLERYVHSTLDLKRSNMEKLNALYDA